MEIATLITVKKFQYNKKERNKLGNKETASHTRNQMK